MTLGADVIVFLVCCKRIKRLKILCTVSAIGHGFHLHLEASKQQMQLKLRHQNVILQQHLQQELVSFQEQVAELQIQVDTSVKAYWHQHRARKKYLWKEKTSLTKSVFFAGACIVKHSESYRTGAFICLFTLCWEYVRSPDVILQRDNSPGNCWALRGSQGYVVIKLSKVICPASVALDHISKTDSLTEEIPSALKNFAIYGMKEDFEEERTFLGEFVYDKDGSPNQMFKLEVANLEHFGYLQLRVLSNWGHPNYTCIYGFHVHGDPVLCTYW
ncbi:PREDICTED: SUN domain-containing protein 2-like [Gavialis gangeticus]|uniref:SUN domain-containing protein 2-like n=1 Tax=Gavialis gangeticus TaxID=94835 RepID=UPI00092F7C90|nr:PREDICTED: SUN domain-containing protein 2-like [Gavialis gangeticus]